MDYKPSGYDPSKLLKFFWAVVGAVCAVYQVAGYLENTKKKSFFFSKYCSYSPSLFYPPIKENRKNKTKKIK